MNRKLDIQYCRALIIPETINEQEMTVEVTFATETPVFRSGWEEDYNEILVCDASAVCMERAEGGLPVLDNHGLHESVLKQFGRTIRVWIDEAERRGRALIKLSKRKRGKELFQDIIDGIIKDISFGYRIFKFEKEYPEGAAIPNYRATRWQPYEISFVNVPADINARVRSSEEANEVEILDKSNKHNNLQKRQIMIKVECPTCGHEWEAAEADNYSCPECAAEFTPLAAGDEAPKAATKKAEGEKGDPDGKAEGAELEAERKLTDEKIAQIRSQAKAGEKGRLKAIELAVRTADLSVDYAIELFELGYALEECYKKIIEKKSEMENEKRKIDPTHTAKVGEEAINKKRDAAMDAILSRALPQTFAAPKDNYFRGMTLVEIGKELLTERGISTRGKSREEIYTTLFAERAHSTSDFPKLLENAMHKILRADYQLAAEYWHLIARQTSVTDFREKNLYQYDTETGMDLTPEGGEIKYATSVEAKQTIRVENYSKGYRLTRQLFINDDLDFLSRIPSNFVRNWMLKRGDLVWSLIIDNAKMSDGKEMFCAAHNNLGTGATSVLSKDGLKKAYNMLISQTDLTGNTIRQTPKYLIVPPQLLIDAKELITTILPGRTEDVNVFSGMFEIIAEPRLAEASKTWFMTSDPNSVDGLYYAYLEGNDGLRVESHWNFNTDTQDYKVRGDFGTSVIDFRGWVKMKGE